jgi:hypothetical protein
MKIRHLIFISFLFLLTSCFEVREEIDLKTDGSGTYQIVLDMSKSKNMLDIALKMAENDEKMQASGNPLADVDSAFIKGAQSLNGMEGISNAKGTYDKQTYVFITKFDFKNIDALNDALNEMNKRKYPELESFPVIYKFDKKTFERTTHFYLKDLTNFSEQAGGDEQKIAQVQAVMKTAVYSSVIRTPEGKIKKFTNNKAILSADKKELRLSANLQEISEGKISLANVLKIK